MSDSTRDDLARDSEIAQSRACADWRQLQGGEITRHALITFHSRYKYLLMAHSREQYRSLGKLLADHATTPPEQFAPRYIEELLKGLRQPATRGSHTNVLQHLAGYLKRQLSKEEKEELRALILAYRDGVVSLDAPIKLLNHHLSRYPNAYLASQVYLTLHRTPAGGESTAD